MKKGNHIVNLVVVLAILVALNLLGSYIYTYFDLTEDKKYTLTEPTKKLLRGIDDTYFFQVFLEGEYPASITRYRNRVEEVLKEFQKVSPYIEYEFLDPLEGSPDDIKAQQQKLITMGLVPTTVNFFDGKENTRKPMYPYALLNSSNRKTVVNLLNTQGLVNYDDETLNAQESQLEYKFASALQKVVTKDRKLIVFTDGNGELEEKQTAALEKDLRQYYRVARVNLDTMYSLSSDINLMVVAGPNKEISDRNLLLMDQYIMNGGKVIWLMESLWTKLDSISKYQQYIPPQIETGLDDLFFKYGFRIQDNVIADLESTRIPLKVSTVAGKPQYNLFKYYYHLLVSPTGKHPIVKNLDRVNMFFPSTIDTVNSSPDVRKEFLLKSSKYSRYQLYPMTLNFEILKEEPDIKRFNRGNQPIGLLLEGKFESAFKNKLSGEQKDVLQRLNSPYKDKSKETAMIVFSDRDFVKNRYDPNSSRITPIGYNNWEKNVFNGNNELITNSIEYLLDDNGILLSRAKEYKLRMLDNYEVTERKGFWQMLNVLLPLVVLVIFGFLYNFLRKRKYSRQVK